MKHINSLISAQKLKKISQWEHHWQWDTWAHLGCWTTDYCWLITQIIKMQMETKHRYKWITTLLLTFLKHLSVHGVMDAFCSHSTVQWSSGWRTILDGAAFAIASQFCLWHHLLLLERLEQTIALRRTVLKWINIYERIRSLYYSPLVLSKLNKLQESGWRLF